MCGQKIKNGHANIMINERKKITNIISTIVLIAAIVLTSVIPSGQFIYAEEEEPVDIPTKFKITFDPNGGKVSTKTRDLEVGSVYGKLPTPKKSGHKFLGWYTKIKGGSKITAKTVFNGSEDTTIYARYKQYVVVIDPGHQAKGNYKTEPIGPGSKTRKAKVSSGTSGVYTKKTESSVNLKVAKKLRKALKDKGIKVVMTRTKQKVNISNAQRAKKANNAKADLCIRIHCDSSPSSSTKGITTLVPKKNGWTNDIYKRSLKAGKLMQKSMVKYTKAKSRGISKRGDLTGFNWSNVTVVLVEMGFMSNKSEDKKLSNKEYQKKLVKGYTKGTLKYLKTV